MEKTHFKVKLLGTSFTIQSSENKEHLEKVLEYYRARVNEIAGKTVAADPLKIAIIAGLNVADELFKERDRLYTQQGLVNPRELEKITDRMIDKIENTLGDL